MLDQINSPEFINDDYNINNIVYIKKFNRNKYEDFYYTRKDSNMCIDNIPNGTIYLPPIIKDIKDKVAKPLFDTFYIDNNNCFEKAIRLINREQKMINEGYTITKKIRTSKVNGNDCGVCMDKINKNNIPLQICDCTNAEKHLCTDCIYNTIKNGKTKCSTFMTKIFP